MSDFAASTNPLIRSQDTPPIPLKTNLPIIHTALAKNADARIVEFSGLDHLLQPTSSGLPAEYRAFELALSQLTSACRAWILEGIISFSTNSPRLKSAG